jgi:hypothetical protein
MFLNNTATAAGGGAVNNDGTPRYANVIFWMNSGNSAGAALNREDANVFYTNVVSANNTVSSNGAGFYNTSNAHATIVNSILWGDTGADEIDNVTGGMALISYSLVEGSGGSGAWDNSYGTNGGNNIDVDPMFVNAPAGSLQLALGSPAIDVGDNNATYLPPTDIDGRARIRDGVVDMGPYEFGDLPTGIGDIDAPATPRVSALRNAFPNPFNPTLTIAYDLATPGRVQLYVYDVAGRLVRRLVDEHQAAGAYRMTWDGRNTSGTRVSTGVYFIRYQTPEVRFQRKVVLLK